MLRQKLQGFNVHVWDLGNSNIALDVCLLEGQEVSHLATKLKKYKSVDVKASLSGMSLQFGLCKCSHVEL